MAGEDLTVQQQAPKTTVRPYVGVNAGVTNYVGTTMTPNATAEIGGRLNSGSLRAEAGARIGTEVGARAEVGYTVPLKGDKIGLDLTAGADYSQQLAFKSHNSKKLTVTTDDGLRYDYKPDMYTTHAGAALKIQPSEKFSISGGVEGGYRGNTLPNKSIAFDTPVGQKELSINPHKSEWYVTPKIAAEYNINKNMQINANGSLNGAQVGFSYTF